jgi:hypothetical protein
VGERAGLLLRSVPPRLPLARQPHLGSRKRSGVGGGGGVVGGFVCGGLGGGRREGGRRASRSGGRWAPPRRPRGVRRAAAGGREAPRGRGLANSSVLGRGGSRLAPPGPLRPPSFLQLRSPLPRARLSGWPRPVPRPWRPDLGWGWGLWKEAEDLASPQWRLRGGAAIPVCPGVGPGKGRWGPRLRSLEVARPPPAPP